MDGTRARVLLGVSELATVDDVRRAFRRRAQAVHPDHGGAPRQFGEVRSALDTLLAVVPTAPPARVYGPVDVYDVTPPVLSAVTMEYTGGLLTGVVNGLGHGVTRSYDGIGNTVGVKDLLGYVTRREYDGLGRVTKVTDALQGVTQGG